MARGTIKLWLAAKNYGFIKPDDGSKDVFFAANVIAPATALKEGAIKEGDSVEFDLAAGTKIPQASRVART